MRIENYFDCKQISEIMGNSVQYVYQILKEKEVKGIVRPSCCHKIMVPKSEVMKLLELKGKSYEESIQKFKEIESKK